MFWVQIWTGFAWVTVLESFTYKAGTKKLERHYPHHYAQNTYRVIDSKTLTVVS